MNRKIDDITVGWNRKWFVYLVGPKQLWEEAFTAGGQERAWLLLLRQLRATAAVSTTTSSTSIFQTGLCSAKAEGQPKSWIISIVDIVPKKEVFLSAFILQFYAQKRGEKGTAFFSSARASHQKKNQIFSFSLFFWFQMLFSKSWQSPIKPFFTAPPFCACWKVPSTSVLDLGRKKGLAQLSFTRTLKIGALKPPIKKFFLQMSKFCSTPKMNIGGH